MTDIRKDFERFYRSMWPNNNSYGLDYIGKMGNSGLIRNYINPTITEERELHVAQMDVFSRLMMDRIIYFGMEVNRDSSNVVVSQLLYLDSCAPGEDIRIFVNSPGGSIYDGYGILDTMASLKSDVATNCTGLAASFGAMILSCGTRGKRTALPHSRIMIHQPSGGVEGKATDIEITYKEITMLKKELAEILAQRTKQPFEKVLADMENDNWMTAAEAKDYGLIDSVVDVKWD